MSAKLIASLTLIGIALPVLGDEPGRFPGIEQLMEPEEYQAAGLEKLTEEEREALNDWLIRYTAWEAPKIRETVEEVKEVEQAFEVTAAVEQPFNGWSGKTIFRLDNGQVWQQRTRGKYYYPGDDSTVTIRRNVFGLYEMELIATGREIGVIRVD